MSKITFLADAFGLASHPGSTADARPFALRCQNRHPLIRAAVLGQISRKAEAGKAVDELLTLVPDFKPRGQSLIRRFAYRDEHVDVLLNGLG